MWARRWCKSHDNRWGSGLHSSKSASNDRVDRVITDDDPDKAQSLATQLGAELFALRGRTRPQYLTAAEGVAAVEAAVAGGVDKPVVIADTGDNPGGGLPGDSTNLLRPLLASAKANRLCGLAVGSVCDPQAVQLCTAAGEGAQLQLRFGGKLHM